VGKTLWLLTGGAVALALAIDLFTVVVPSLRDHTFLAFILVAAIWAALGLRILLAEARRNQKLVVSFALALAAALSFSTHWFGIAAFFLAYLGVGLLLGTALVLAAVRLLKRKPSLRAFAVPFTMILMGAGGLLLSAWSSRPAPALPSLPMNVSDELSYIYGTDQSDRLTAYMFIDPARDRIRLQRVKALYRAGQITRPMDQLHAAFVFQHASCADDYQVAYELATAAEASHQVPRAYPPLSHMAYDRWQLSVGGHQKYGTQLLPVSTRPCPPAR